MKYLFKLVLAVMATALSAYAQTVATPVFTMSSGTLLYPRAIAVATSTSGATICYTIDGSTPTAPTPGTCTNGITLASGSTITISAATTVKAIGTLSAYTNSAVGVGTYTMQVSTPQFSPVSNSYTTSQTVSISTVTTGAAIHYSVGSIADCSSALYSAPISVSATETLYAIGCLSGYGNAPVRAIYNIRTYTPSTPGADDDNYCGTGDVPLFPNDGAAVGPQSCNYTKRVASPSNGTTHVVNTASDFTIALATAACGDNIVITAGATIQGNFTLAANPCDSAHWITIKTSGLSNFPLEGTRATPCYFGVLSLPGRPTYSCGNPINYGARIIGSGANGRPLTFSSGTQYVRLEGLEIGVDPANVFPTEAEPNYGIISFSAGNINHIVLDQLWVHGNANNETEYYWGFGGASGGNYPTTNMSLIDSTLTDVHCAASIGYCNQSVGVTVGGTGDSIDGTFKVVNNYIESAGEIIFMGGSESTTVASDVEIRENYLFKPLTWDPASPTYNGGFCNSATPPVCDPFVAENILETKNVDHYFAEGNRLQNSWGGFSQVGEAITLTPKNQSNLCPVCQDTNVIIRYNYGSTVTEPYQMAEVPSNSGGAPYAWGFISIHDNLWDDLYDPVTCGPSTPTQCAANAVGLTGFGVTSYNYNTPTWAPGSLAHDETTNHDTYVVPTTPAYQPTALFGTTGPKAALQYNFGFTNNIGPSGHYGFLGGSGGGTLDCGAGYSITNMVSGLNACTTSWIFTNNAIVSGLKSGWNWPTGQFFPAAYSSVGFVNYNGGIGGDYRLCTGVGTPAAPCTGASLYHNAGSDGLDIGVSNVPLVTLLTGSAVTGGGGIAPPTGLSVSSACSGNAAPTVGCNGVGSMPLLTNAANTGAETTVIDPLPSSVSPLSIKSYLYAGATTRIMAEYQPWFCNTSTPCGGHQNIGMQESNSAQVLYQATWMRSIGADVVDVDYYGCGASCGEGSGQAYNLSVTTALANAIAANPTVTPKFMIVLDQGAFNGSGTGQCPPAGGDQSACLEAAIETQVDYLAKTWLFQSYYEKNASNGHPIVLYFINQGSWPGTIFNTVFSVVASHATAGNSCGTGCSYSATVDFVDENAGAFSETGIAGGFAWPQPQTYTPTTQYCWQYSGGCSFNYLADFYSHARSNPTKIAVGAMYKGFDDHNASWGANRVIAQQCGQVLGFTAAAIATAGYSASSQLQYVQLDTWNDYEEATELETGVSSCYTLNTPVITGSTLSWSLAHSDSYASTNTISSFQIYTGTTSPTTMFASGISPTSTSHIAPAPSTGQNVWVYAVGAPLIQDFLSPPVSNSVVVTVPTAYDSCLTCMMH